MYGWVVEEVVEGVKWKSDCGHFISNFWFSLWVLDRILTMNRNLQREEDQRSTCETCRNSKSILPQYPLCASQRVLSFSSN